MPATATSQPFSVVLLAGGRGQRMGGLDKGLVHWQARPMIAWLHEVVRPLTDDLIISCNRNQQAYGAYACLLYTSPSPRDKRQSRMPSSA